MATTHSPIRLIDTMALDVARAYNFKVTNCASVGFIEALSFTSSGKALAADTPIPDPENPESPKKVVAILDLVDWTGGPTDPIRIKGRLSPGNRGTLLECVSSLTGGADVEAAWSIYVYDYAAKKYFKRFHTDGKNIKMALTEGETLFVDEAPDSYIKQPVNFKFSLSLTPKSDGGEQTLAIATSANQKFARQVGISVAC